MLYIYLENFMKEEIPKFLGLIEWKQNYLFFIEILYEHRNLFLWILVMTMYMSAILNDNVIINSYNNNLKKIKLMEDENKKLKQVIEKLVQRQENYEEQTSNNFMSELDELKVQQLFFKNENTKIYDSINKLVEDINKKDELFEKNLLNLKNTLSIQKSRITRLKNQMEEKMTEISEQYETLSMNDSASIIEGDE